MNLPFLYLMNLVMLVRLPASFSENAIRGRAAGVGVVICLVGLLVLEPTPAVGAAAAVLIALGFAKWWLEGRTKGKPSPRLRFTLLLSHFIAMTWLCSPAYGLEFRLGMTGWCEWAGQYFTPIGGLSTLSWYEVQLWLFGALLASGEANLLVRLLLDRADVGVGVGSEGSQPPVGKSPTQIEYAHGRVIGFLERLIVYTLVVAGEYGAMGWVIAAKGLARFKNLEDRTFAEYFLIGTMLSLVLAGGTALLVRAAMP